MTVAVRDELRMLDGGGGEDIAWLSVWLSGGQSDFESQDVVVHVEAVSYVEVALAEDTEAEMVVESDRRIVAVHVQFDTGFASTCSLPHMIDSTVKQGSAESVALFRWKYIDFLKVKEQAAVIGDSLMLYGDISACLPIAVCDVIYMSLVKLLLQIFRRVHPFHHVLHLLRRQDFPICMPEHNLSHVMNAHDILA